jgi:hypothetical protein
MKFLSLPDVREKCWHATTYTMSIWIILYLLEWYKRIYLQLVKAEVDFLLASVSQVSEATSVVWRRGVPRANVNRVQRREEGDKKKWFRTIISVYTWRRSQKAVDTAQTLMWMCIHRKPRRKHTHRNWMNYVNTTVTWLLIVTPV